MIKINKTQAGKAIFLSMAVSLTACHTVSNQQSAKTYTGADVTWTKHKDIAFAPATADTLPKNTANLVFYRDLDDLSDQTTVNIGINDRYQASLRAGNYTAIASCVGDNKISTIITEKKINNLQFNPNVIDMMPAKNYYFKVSVNNGKSTAKRVTEKQALAEIKDKLLQTHTISRVQAKNCQPYEPRTPDPVPVSNLNLFKVFYFDFDIDKMTPAETQRAFNFGKEILQTGKDYEVFLSGHADPVGTNSYNKPLSRRRAINVAKTLEQAGVKASSIKLGSFGESKPIELTCNGIKTKATRNGCNLKNRRVEALVKLKKEQK